jgi:hypothetical protein
MMGRELVKIKSTAVAIAAANLACLMAPPDVTAFEGQHSHKRNGMERASRTSIPEKLRTRFLKNTAGLSIVF